MSRRSCPASPSLEFNTPADRPNGGYNQFLFNSGFGKEVITDFNATTDQLDFDHSLFGSAKNALDHAKPEPGF